MSDPCSADRRAATGPVPVRLPAVVITGASRDVRKAAASAWRAGSRVGGRWLRVLSGVPATGRIGAAGSGAAGSAAAGSGAAGSDAAGHDVSHDAGRDPDRAGGADPETVVLGAGCACCLAGPVFRSGLVRLIARHRPAGLILDVASGGHPDRLIDQLREPPFDGLLALAPSIHVLAAEAGQGAAADVAIPEHAGQVWVEMAGSGRPVGDGPRPSLPWPFMALDPGSAGRQRADPEPSGRGFARFVPDDRPPVAGARVLVRPADRPVSRATLAAACAALAGDSAVGGFIVLWRTPRAWYRCSHGRRDGWPAASGQVSAETGPVVAETGWRADNRIVVWPTVADPASAATGHSSVDAALARWLATIEEIAGAG